MTRLHHWILTGIWAVSVAAAVLTAARNTWFAGILAAVLVGVVAMAGWRWGAAGGNWWTIASAAGLLAGIVAFAAARWVENRCTAGYGGGLVVIGTELTEYAREYVLENPDRSHAEALLSDNRGQPRGIWTDASIERCELALAGVGPLWVPLFGVSLASAAVVWASRWPVLMARPVARTSAPAAMRYDAFVSYRHGGEDERFARRLVEELEAAGYRLAIDGRDFAANENFLSEMERCIRESRFTLAVVSARYLGSGNCEEEAVIAKVLDMEQRRRRLVPLLLQRVEMPAWMYGIVGIDFTASDPMVDPLARLKATLGEPLSRPA
jgi:hypothetical protein